MRRLLSIVFAALPIGFAAIRWLSTGTDLRYLWVALASAFGAVLVIALGKARSGTQKGVLGLSAMVLVVATLFGGSMALLLGTRFGPALLIVSLAFAFCWSASYALAKA